MKNNNQFKKGQVLLLVTIIMLIGVVIVSSIASRSLTGTKTAIVNTDSNRALNAAETGIEEALNQDLSALIGEPAQVIHGVDKSIVPTAGYTVTELATETPIAIPEDGLIQFEFDPASTDTIRVRYENPACLEISLYDEDNNVTRQLVCGNGVSDIANEDQDDTCSTGGYDHCVRLDLSATASGTTTLLLIKVLNASTRIALVGAGDLSTQFVQADSYAVTNTNVRREVQVTTKTTKDVFPVFDYALYIK